MSSRRSTFFLLALVVPVAAMVIAGCGGSSKANNSSSTTTTSTQSKSGATGAAGGAQTLNLSADPTGKLAFSPMTLSAKSGKVTLVMKNPSTSGSQHGIAVEGNGVDKDGPIVQPGKTST